MSFIIKEVLTKQDYNTFINLPWEIYKDNPHWVAPLKLSVKQLLSPKHPFHKTADSKMWVAKTDQGRPLGRIMGIVNHHYNDFHDDQCGHIGFFECVPDKKVSNELFKVAEKYLRENGMKRMQGPYAPSTNYECGLLVDGYNGSPQIMMPYHHSYYKDLFEEYGQNKIMDLIAYQFKIDTILPEKIIRIHNRKIQSNHITWRTLDKKKWNQEVDLMLSIYNSAWEKNWGFIPMTEEEFRHTANDLKSICDPDLILFVLVKGEPAGFTIALPDYNQVFKQIPSGKLLPTGIFKLFQAKKYIHKVRVLTLGIKKEFRHLGLGPILYTKLQEQIQKTTNIDEVEMSWILETNKDMNRPLQLMGAIPYRTYRIYEKQL